MKTLIDRIGLLCLVVVLFSLQTDAWAQEEWEKNVSKKCKTCIENCFHSIEKEDHKEMGLYIDSVYAYCPDSVYGLVLEPYMKHALGEKEETIKYLDEILQHQDNEFVQYIFGENIFLHYHVASFKAELGDTSSIDSLIKADHERFFRLALEQIESEKDRIRIIGYYLERYPEYKKLLFYYMSIFYTVLNDEKKSIEYATRALEAEGDLLEHHYVSLFFIRGINLYQLNQPEKAVSDLEQCIFYYEKDGFERDDVMIDLSSKKQLLLGISTTFYELED